MVKILAISDLHENIDMLRDILSLVDFDMLILAGDIAELRVLELYEVLRNIDGRVIVINGNHDCVRCLERISSKLSNVDYIFRGKIEVEIDGEKLVIVGISGIYGKRGDSPHYYSDNHLMKFLSRLQKEDVRADIIVSHTPPYKHADFLPKGGRGGLKQLIAFKDLCEPKYWVAGHTHVLAAEKHGETVTINCGLGYIGDFALIETTSEKVIISRLLTEYIDLDENPEWNFVYLIRRTRSIRRLLRAIASKIAEVW